MAKKELDPTKPFAYGIQAPIGSVTPLFHKLKDAEDYIAKLTDSRDAAKIIPLYRDAMLDLKRIKAVEAGIEAVDIAVQILEAGEVPKILRPHILATLRCLLEQMAAANSGDNRRSVGGE